MKDRDFDDLPLREVPGVPFWQACCFTFVSVLVVLAWAGAFR